MALTIRLVDRSPDAHERLADHTLRAQRLVWLSDGLMHPDAKLPEPTDISDEALLAIEALGREVAHRRSARSPFGEDHELPDSSVLVTQVEKGSLVLCTTIVVAGGVAAYLARLFAKDKGERRRLELRLRVVSAVEEQLQNEALSNSDRREIILKMIERLGAGFEREIVESLTISVPGVGEIKLSTGFEAADEEAVAKTGQDRALAESLVPEGG
ncbi:MAG: hypothetical protein AAF721_03820 [Myxococcota bacterium]